MSAFLDYSQQFTWTIEDATGNEVDITPLVLPDWEVAWPITEVSTPLTPQGIIRIVSPIVQGDPCRQSGVACNDPALLALTFEVEQDPMWQSGQRPLRLYCDGVLLYTFRLAKDLKPIPDCTKPNHYEAPLTDKLGFNDVERPPKVQENFLTETIIVGLNEQSDAATDPDGDPTEITTTSVAYTPWYWVIRNRLCSLCDRDDNPVFDCDADFCFPDDLQPYLNTLQTGIGNPRVDGYALPPAESQGPITAMQAIAAQHGYWLGLDCNECVTLWKYPKDPSGNPVYRLTADDAAEAQQVPHPDEPEETTRVISQVIQPVEDIPPNNDDEEEARDYFPQGDEGDSDPVANFPGKFVIGHIIQGTGGAAANNIVDAVWRKEFAPKVPIPGPELINNQYTAGATNTIKKVGEECSLYSVLFPEVTNTAVILNPSKREVWYEYHFPDGRPALKLHKIYLPERMVDPDSHPDELDPNGVGTGLNLVLTEENYERWIYDDMLNTAYYEQGKRRPLVTLDSSFAADLTMVYYRSTIERYRPEQMGLNPKWFKYRGEYLAKSLVTGENNADGTFNDTPYHEPDRDADTLPKLFHVEQIDGIPRTSHEQQEEPYAIGEYEAEAGSSPFSGLDLFGRTKTYVFESITNFETAEFFVCLQNRIAQHKRISWGVEHPINSYDKKCISHFDEVAIDNGKQAKHGVRDGLYLQARRDGELCYVVFGYTLNIMGDTDRFSRPKRLSPPPPEDCTFVVQMPDVVGADCIVVGELIGV